MRNRWLRSLVLLTATLSGARAVAQERSVWDPKARFDSLVREDFFDGCAGDRAALERAMKTCVDALKIDPHNADALAWEGSGWICLGGQAAARGQKAEALQLSDRGYKEMDYAIAENPGNISTLIVRGATLLSTSQEASPGGVARARLTQGVADYERVLALEKPWFQHVSKHGRGELLMGIADGWLRLGDRDHARFYFERVARELPATKYGNLAAAWLAGKLDPQTPVTCIGCH
jgi:hypothetical protein